LKDYLLRSVRGQPADYVEVRVEDTRVSEIAFRGPNLDTIGQNVNYGGCVRALVNGGWGFCSFNSLDDLPAQVSRAIASARAAATGQRDKEKVILSPVAPVVDEVRLEIDPAHDPRRLSLAHKKEVLQAYNDLILSRGKPIQSSSVYYEEKVTRVTFASSEGAYTDQEKIDIGGGIGAVAAGDGHTQFGRVGYGGSSGFDVALGLEDKVRRATDLAVSLVSAPTVTGGEYTVILDPRLAGIFVHEAFGHLSEGDNVHENPNLLKLMTLGERFGQDHLSIYDSGLDAGARGYLRYDDEGVPTGKTYLIKDGILVGRLHSRETAGKMGEKVTGNARAMDYRFPPICRMRNTCIEAGTASFEDMLAGVKLGIYCNNSYGGQTMGEMFTFSAGECYMIRDGRLAELVRDVNLAGNVFATLKNIDLVARDFSRHESGGGCGKGGQGPLATSEWAPHVRIQKVVVGGKGQ
jgi:TldD protein